MEAWHWPQWVMILFMVAISALVHSCFEEAMRDRRILFEVGLFVGTFVFSWVLQKGGFW